MSVALDNPVACLEASQPNATQWTLGEAAWAAKA
jgi:hypothetical protein